MFSDFHIENAPFSRVFADKKVVGYAKTKRLTKFQTSFGVDYFRRCSALDTAGLWQPSEQDKKTNGEQVSRIK